ncbi:MAG: MMPL family transporter, partial [Gordonia sp. (in: high G+C Gram-positive bacteria)]
MSRPRLITTAVVLLLAVAGLLLLPSTASKLGSGGMTADSAESVRAEKLLKEQFSSANPDVVLVLTPSKGNAAAAQELVTKVSAMPHVKAVHSAFTDMPVDELKSGDTGLAFVIAEPGSTPAELLAVADDARAAGRKLGVQVNASGDGVIDGSIDKIAESSLVRAELIAAPLVGLILLVVFGSVWAALMPIVAGGASVAITMLALNILVRFTDVSTFALNLASAIGFGLAVDYSLFIIARWREGRMLGMTAEEARSLTVRTSGRTIVFSGVTVVIAMAALLIFPGYFLKSLAYAGIITVTTVMIVTVLVVPWMLVALDKRAVHRYGWSRWAGVEHDPAVNDVKPAPGRGRVWISAILITGVLAVVALPFLNANFILRDYRELPADDIARVGTEQVTQKFPGLSQNSVNIAFPKTPATAELSATADKLAKIDDVTVVLWGGGATVAHDTNGAPIAPVTAPPTAFDRAVFDSSPGHTWIRVNLSVDPESPEAATVVDRVRAEVAPIGGIVGGQTATLVDSTHDINKYLPYAIAAIVVVTAVLLFPLISNN